MYNRYIPNGMAYTRVTEEDAPPFARPGGQGHPQPPDSQEEPPHREEAPPQRTQEPRRAQSDQRPPQPPPSTPHRWPWSLSGQTGQTEADKGEEKGKGLLSGLLKSFHLDDLDTGDILLLLILVFLILDGDGDNLELIVTLGLVILFSLGDKEKEKDAT